MSDWELDYSSILAVDDAIYVADDGDEDNDDEHAGELNKGEDQNYLMDEDDLYMELLELDD